MKVLITNSGPRGTGSFTIAESIVKELQRQGHEVRFFFPDNTHLPPHIEDADYTIWRFPVTNGEVTLDEFPLMIPDPHPKSVQPITYRDLPQESFDFFFEEARSALAQVIDAFQPDIIDCQHIWTLSKPVATFGIPFFCNANHSDQLAFVYDERMRPIAVECAQKAHAVFAISEFVRSEVLEHYGVDPSHVKTLIPGFNNTIFSPSEESKTTLRQKLNLNVPQDAVVFTFPGALSTTKGFDTLVEAAKLLPDSLNIHILVLGAGKPPQEAKHIKHLHFLGHVPQHQLALIHQASNFSMLLSRSEGLGLALMEAMGCGLPVIYTERGGLKEFSVGKQVPAEDPKAAAEAMEALAALSQSEYEALSHQAINRAQMFSWESNIKTRVRYYEDAR